MALRKIQNANISVVAFNDSAVTCTREMYDSYLKTLDETMLMLEGEPTRFIMRTELPFEVNNKLEQSRMSVGTSGIMTGDMSGMTVTVNMAIAFEEVRAALIDIKNPNNVPEDEQIKFVQEIDGLASKALIMQLHAHKMIADLNTARSSHSDKQSAANVKKK